ncbi:class I SAM-dependent methyltransferase [Thiolapillus sp.]
MTEQTDKDQGEQHQELMFSSVYTQERADRYFRKHQESLSRRLSDWREKQIARKVLEMAGNPRSVLDLPCGAGRFWPVLAEDPGRRLLAADYSEAMLETARKYQPAELVERFHIFQTSAFDIDLDDEAVEHVFCMRLMHHIGEAADRMKILREFHRVTSDSVSLSLWVDGNYKGWRRRRLEAQRASGKKEFKRKFQDRFVQSPAVLEKEFAEAGFDVLGKVDFLPGYSHWRTYVLRKTGRAVR